MKRKSYSPEFKAKIALEAIKGVMTANEIGAKYEVHPVQISQWKKELLENAGSLFDGKRSKKTADDEQVETGKLYEEIGRLKIEVDWLKKKSEQLSKM